MITRYHSIRLALLIPLGRRVANEFSELKYSILHIGKVNPKNNSTMGNSPLQVLKRKEIWAWLFQLVIPFVDGNKICEECLG